jgi:hypothetical protein
VHAFATPPRDKTPSGRIERTQTFEREELEQRITQLESEATVQQELLRASREEAKRGKEHLLARNNENASLTASLRVQTEKVELLSVQAGEPVSQMEQLRSESLANAR